MIWLPSYSIVDFEIYIYIYYEVDLYGWFSGCYPIVLFNCVSLLCSCICIYVIVFLSPVEGKLIPETCWQYCLITYK